MVIDIVAYERREKMLKLREELLSIEEDRILGKKGYTLEETIKSSEPKREIKELSKE